MAKTVNIPTGSLKNVFGNIQNRILDYVNSLDQYERYANIAMLVGVLLIITAVILW
jgi:hypothetical protein